MNGSAASPTRPFGSSWNGLAAIPTTTQQLCHTIYANGSAAVGLDDVKLACEQLMKQGEAVYLQYRQMLTDKQWAYLIAVAKEGDVRQISSAAFLKRHKIGTPSVSRRLADALCEKGLLNDEPSLDGTTYSLSDVFLSHWMERTFQTE